MPTIELANKSSAIDETEAEQIYASLLSSYNRAGKSVEVDFRELIPNVGSVDRATHLLHSYPAKLLRHIPALVVSSPQLCPEKALVLDPFCGSGTTLVEAFLAGRSATGIDVNPLAVLISKVKTTPIQAPDAYRGLKQVLARARQDGIGGRSHSDRLTYWYHDRQLQELCCLRDALAVVTDQQTLDLMKVALSATARDVSLANPRISVPVRLRPEAYPKDHALRDRLATRLNRLERVNVVAAFSEAAEKAIGSVERLRPFASGQTVSAELGDARSAATDPSQVDLILTSPPYLGAQKYIRATSLNLLCLEIADSAELKRLQKQSIGREFFRKEEYADARATGIKDADRVISRCRASNPMRAHLAAEYLADMRSALAAMVARLRTGGALVLIVGGNQLCGEEFDTPAYLRTLCVELGLTVELQLIDTIRSRGLMTRRNREASPIAAERVLVFRK
jgi:SAM-dependent methyltransferase